MTGDARPESGGRKCDRCEECYWFRPFPHFVHKVGGFCSHPAACRSVSPRLFLAENEETCRRCLPKSVYGAAGPGPGEDGDE